MDRLTSKQQKVWNKQARTYDKKMSALERRIFPTSREWACSRAHGSTLEVGIGSGANLRHYPPAVSLTGIDLSSEMLAIARADAARLGRSVDLHEGDATHLPFDDESFDTVVSTFAFCCIPDDRAGLDEAVRVLKPGGSLLLTDHVVAPTWPIRTAQRVLEAVTVPLQGEHFTRRPYDLVRELQVTIEETQRLSRGVIEHIHAHKNERGAGQV